MMIPDYWVGLDLGKQADTDEACNICPVRPCHAAAGHDDLRPMIALKAEDRKYD